MMGKVFLLSVVAMIIMGTSTANRSTRTGDKIVLVTSDAAIYKAVGDDAELQPLSIPGVSRPYGIDVDLEAGFMFITDTRHRQVQRASLDGSHFAVVATSSSGSSSSGPRGIAIDPNELEIYWTDSATRSIEMVKYDGSGRRRVKDLSSYHQYGFPLSIAIDKQKRKLYYHYYQYIRRCSCSGSGSETITHVDSSSSIFVGLAFNAFENRLFWSKHNYVKSYNLLTASKKYIHLRSSSGSEVYAYGIARFEEELYITTNRKMDNSLVGSVNERDGAWRGQPMEHRGIPFEGTGPRDIFVGRVRPTDPNNVVRCDFEKIMCGILWSSPKKQWKLSGDQLSDRALGPYVDHTTGERTGQYIMMSTANKSHSTGDAFTLTGPPVNVSGSSPLCFRFWYYMHHVSGGYLKVFFQPEANRSESLLPLWSTYSQQPDEWAGVQVEMPASSVGRFVFMAIVGDPDLFEVAVDDIEFGTCREGSKLQCNDTFMTVFLDKAALGVSTLDSISMRHSPCRGYEFDSETMAITTSYTECGTTSHEREGAIDFINHVSILARSGIRHTNIDIAVNCSLGRNYETELTYLSHRWVQQIHDQALGNFSVSFRQFPTEKFYEPFPVTGYPNQVEEGEFLYLATNISFVKDTLSLQNARCWATQTPNPLDDVQHTIISDGCPVLGGVRVFSPQKLSSLRPFSIKAFSFREEMDLIYVHCDVIICQQSDQASACDVQDCSHPSRNERDLHSRRARDVSNSGPHIVSQGPFIPRRARSSAGVSSSRSDGYSVPLIVASVCFMLLALTVIVVYALHSCNK